MNVTDRQNWLLSGGVAVGLVANGVVLVLGSSGTVDLVLAGLLITGGLLALGNAVVGYRDPDAVEADYWTTRKTVVNAVAFVVLFGLLAVDLV
jgi:hypothetical protein